MPAVPPVCADTVTAAVCGADLPYTRVDVVDQTGSTNADLAERARAGAAAGEVLVAEYQTAGRGRFTRRWEGVPGANIAFSVLWEPKIPMTRWGWLPLVAGLAIHEGLVAVGAPAHLKWPNDVLLDGVAPGKVCGVLAEMVLRPQGPACVIGAGINVGLDAGELPVPTATSLHLAGLQVSKTDVLIEVLRAWARWQARLEAGEDLASTYAQVCSTIGKHVRVQLDAEGDRGETIEGEAVDVDVDGELIVVTEGRRRKIPAGDVFHVR